mmetsp:Transcript_99841/g.279599  ORF Transcript_99841/g.279599 Transcript_99841/m.279599 type:complete len:224 (+) Transcript_99841:57-728(+)
MLRSGAAGRRGRGPIHRGPGRHRGRLRPQEAGVHHPGQAGGDREPRGGVAGEAGRQPREAPRQPLRGRRGRRRPLRGHGRGDAAPLARAQRGRRGASARPARPPQRPLFGRRLGDRLAAVLLATLVRRHIGVDGLRVDGVLGRAERGWLPVPSGARRGGAGGLLQHRGRRGMAITGRRPCDGHARDVGAVVSSPRADLSSHIFASEELARGHRPRPRKSRRPA